MKRNNKWRFIDTGVRTAAENMALDDAILEAHSKGLIPNTLRFLQFSPNAVLVGYHQSVDKEIRVDFCEKRGIEINRRITGGGALYFDSSQLGWELFASKDDLDVSVVNEVLFEKICQGVIKGLKKLGLDARFRPKNDIEIRGRKISGTGGTEVGNSFMFQGTLLVDFDVHTMLRALRIPTKKLEDKEIDSVKDRVTWLSKELGSEPDLSTLKKYITEGFEEVFSVELKKDKLSKVEKTLFEKKLIKTSSKEWIYMSKLDEGQALFSSHKTEGGLIKVSLVLARRAKIIEQIIITGDFFAFPVTGIYDLEAALKGIKADSEKIRRTILDFFEKGDVRIVGIEPGDIAVTIDKALSKIKYLQYGFNLDEANHIFTVVESFEEIRKTKPDLLLLPYCSKETDCEYRYKKDCTICGKCTIGDAYQMGQDNDLIPISIISFEDLIKTLLRYKKKDKRAFIGCCCEPFYIKHEKDFERAGLPGILINIDNTTCYELGEEKKAYAGTFDKKTDLRVDLLKKVIDLMNNGKV